jgi:hypothetical protein
MTPEQFLSLLDHVRPGGTDQWSAQCPGHARQRTGALSIRRGEDGRTLVYDFGGCSVETICQAVGVHLKDLFADAGFSNREAIRDAQREREAARRQRERENQITNITADAHREAERLIRRMTGMDISAWSDSQLDLSLNSLANAYHLLDREPDSHE